MEVISDGTRWIPNGVQVLSRDTIAFSPAPTGTMANNGAITLGTALTLTYSQGLYLYLPANAISASSAAGWYWTVMSSTTVGQVFNNTYTSGAPTVPGSPTAFATTGPGAYTGVTTEITGPQITLNGGLAGIQGTVDLYSAVTVTNSANNKTLEWTLGGTQIFAFANASSTGFGLWWSFTNDNSASAQICANNGFGLNTQNAVTRTTVDTSTDKTMAITLQRATATEIMVLDRYIFRVSP
jgi:hypothetical protein